jgi:hypothetical protein
MSLASLLSFGTDGGTLVAPYLQLRVIDLRSGTTLGMSLLRHASPWWR